MTSLEALFWVALAIGCTALAVTLVALIVTGAMARRDDGPPPGWWDR